MLLEARFAGSTAPVLVFVNTVYYFILLVNFRGCEALCNSVLTSAIQIIFIIIMMTAACGTPQSCEQGNNELIL